MPLPVLCMMDVAGLRAWWGRWSRRELLTILPGGMLGILLGSLAFGLLDDRSVKLLVGVITLAFLARSLWQARPGRPVPAPARSSRLRGGFWATLSALTSTVAHAGGPPLAVYLYPLRLDRATLAATTVVFFGVVNYVKLVPYFLLGQFSAANLLTSLLLLPLAPLGIRLGIWLQARLSDRTFYRAIYVLRGHRTKLVWNGLGL